MRRQIRLMGTSYDWTREIATCEPEYYRWNQWLFLRLYEQGLAYKREAPVNWCPHDRTVLANEQVERRTLLALWNAGRTPQSLAVVSQDHRLCRSAARRPRTLPGWPERTKTMQRNWIGRSEGVAFSFDVDGLDERIEVFTTRIDTVYGVTFLAMAPEHPVAEALTAIVSPERAAAMAAFAASLKSKSELERTQPDGKRQASSPAPMPSIRCRTSACRSG